MIKNGLRDIFIVRWECRVVCKIGALAQPSAHDLQQDVYLHYWCGKGAADLLVSVSNVRRRLKKPTHVSTKTFAYPFLF